MLSDCGSYRYTSHVTKMFTYQTPTSHALLAHGKCYLSAISVPAFVTYLVKIHLLLRRTFRVEPAVDGAVSPWYVKSTWIFLQARHCFLSDTHTPRYLSPASIIHTPGRPYWANGKGEAGTSKSDANPVNKPAADYCTICNPIHNPNLPNFNQLFFSFIFYLLYKFHYKLLQ